MNNGKTEVLYQIRVRVPREHFDATCDFITDRICTGLVLEDEEDRGGEVAVLFYSSPENYESHAELVKQYLNLLLGDESSTESRISFTEIKNVIWEDEYRRSVAPVVIGSDIVVRPPWTESPSRAKYDIVIEPKMAFGTGTHETTRTCMLVLRDHLQPDMRFLDFGCGSGILSILADKLGASFIKAIDNDISAVDNASENFEINDVRTNHEIVFGSIEKAAADDPYDIICVNIIKSTILKMIPRLWELTATPGLLILSGLLEQDIDEVYDALNEIGISDVETIEDNEWRTITIARKENT